MNYDNYLLYILGTVDGYPTKTKKHLQNLFVANNIVQRTSQLSLQTINEECMDISELALTDSVKGALENYTKAVTLFEKWEFEKDYKYSVLFSCDDFDMHIKSLVSSVSAILENENEITSEVFDNPVLFQNDKQLILKFNMVFSAIDPLNQNELLVKYPFLVVFYKDLRIVEFRFDAIKRVFLSEKNEQNVYSNLISEIRKLLREKFDISLCAYDLDYITNLSNSKIEEAIVTAEYKKLPNGGNAQLEVGNNEKFILPIIGDMKVIIEKYKSDLAKVPALADALNQFIFENDELSDYTWIEVMWPNEVKTRSIRVKFIFNYKGEQYTLIQHYYNNILIGMERMNYVTERINQYKTTIQDSNEDG